MEVIVEFLIEIVGEVLIEFLLESSFRGIARLLSNRTVRTVLGIGLAIAVGFGGGYWWGARLTELGRTDSPRSLWVSIGLAGVFLALALAGTRRESGWPVGRLLGFSLLNAAVATGMAVGFTPRPLA